MNEQNILALIKSIYQHGALSYLLNRYVDINAWTNQIKSYFPENFIENFTDFTHGKCFTYFINMSDSEISIWSDDFKNYLLQNKILVRMRVQISVLGPYFTYKFLKYYVNDDVEVKYTESDSSLESRYSIEVQKLLQFANKCGLTFINSDLLNTIVSGLSLELKEQNVTVYHCLFEDGY